MVALTPKAFDLLRVLLTARDRVVEKTELMKLVWPDSFVGEDSLTQNIATLRKALGDAPDRAQYIVTVPRHGYRFAAVVQTMSVQTGAPAERDAPLAAEQPKRTNTWGRGWIAIVAAMTVIASGLAIWLFARTRAITPAAMRFVVAAPAGTSFSQ